MNKGKLYLGLFLSAIILSSCFSTVHETVSNTQKMPIGDATNAIKRSIHNTIQNPYFAEQKAVSDIVISDDGFTLIHPDGTKKYYTYNEILNPVVVHEAIHNLWFIEFKRNNVGDAVLFNSQQAAIMFADALYYLKHTDIKQERAKEREDSRRRAQETAAEEQKERDQKQAEALRLKQKAAMEAEAATAKDESSPEATPEKRKSRPRPAAAKKTAGEPAPRQPEGGAPPVPTLPTGGAVSGN
jgi:hypothetical protein